VGSKAPWFEITDSLPRHEEFPRDDYYDFVLVRHGETGGTQKAASRDTRHFLDEIGLAQADAVGRRLGVQNFNAFIQCPDSRVPDRTPVVTNSEMTSFGGPALRERIWVC